ncbi:MAG: hypothetical protein A2X35_13285 [Elusimicrobia bacterium GWA2_61_42]|nr:MAG: hypothetical protein A2X35_13285 [Elusimicrobia bacterium GWA2_61_42]
MTRKLNEFLRLITLSIIAYLFSYFTPLLLELPHARTIANYLNNLDLRIYAAFIILEAVVIWHYWKQLAHLANRIANTCRLDITVSNSFDDITFVLLATISLLYDFKAPGLFANALLLPNIFGALLFYIYRFTLCRATVAPEVSRKGSESKDEPIDSEDKDLLGRGSFVDKLYSLITSLPFPDPYIIGLNGGWGDGKTSIINLLKKRFEGNSEAIVVDFDPWYFRDEEEIIKSFFHAFESTVSDKYWMGNLRSLFTNYLKVTGFSGLGMRIDFSRDSLKHVQDGIQDAINQLKKDVIIFIDDIDRLEAKEMLVVFKLVRLMAKFQRLRFVLIFDAKRVSTVLAERYKDFVPEYLEKIIQLPVQVPLVEQKCLDNFFDSSISALFSRLGITEETEKEFYSEFPLIYQMHMKRTLANIRQIKRYINSLNFTLPMIREEVSILDFLLLDFLRVFHPEIYTDIQRNPHIYQHFEWGENSFLYYGGGYKQDRKAIIKAHIEKLLTDRQDSDGIKAILEKMFFDVQYAFYGVMTASFSPASYRSAKRISHPDCFYKYFALQVATSDLSDNQIEEVILSWNNASPDSRLTVIAKTFEFYRGKNLQSQLIDKLHDFKASLKLDTTTALIEYIHKNARDFSARRDGTINLSDHTKISFLMLGFINNLEDVSGILEKVMQDTPDMSLLVAIVLSCKEERGGDWHKIYKAADIEKLKSIAAKRLKEYFVDGNKNVFEEYPYGWELILYQWGTYWGKATHEQRRIVSDYVLGIVKNSPKLFVEFIKAQPKKRTAPPGELRFSVEEFSAIYHFEVFLALARSMFKTAKLSDSEKDILTAFIRSYP